MKTIITINMDNAAFVNEDELPRILNKLAKDISDCKVGNKYPLYDSNGNSVGNIVYVYDEEN